MIEEIIKSALDLLLTDRGVAISILLLVSTVLVFSIRRLYMDFQRSNKNLSDLLNKQVEKSYIQNLIAGALFIFALIVAILKVFIEGLLNYSTPDD